MAAKNKQPWDQCQFCMPARCCSYFAFEVDTPDSRKDYEALLWQIAHRGVSFYIHRKRWHIMVDSVCQFLTADNKCGIYETRPYICREHSIESCEYTSNDFGFKEHFKSYQELWEWICENTNYRIKFKPMENGGRPHRQPVAGLTHP
ncbi:MAG: YkgJ family cysteine cluster protein [Nitrospinaceae bacterium]